MPYDSTTQNFTLDAQMEHLMKEKRAALELRKRKEDDWNDNYELCRNKVRTNRLTQRQAVNIPLMKETVKGSLAKIDDSPDVEWKELAGDEYKTLVYQSVWDERFKSNKIELIDVLDKKNVLLYGLSSKKLNIEDDGVGVSVLDVFDFAIDSAYNPWDIETARFIIHTNIFKTVRDILADPKYLEQGKEELKIWADSAPGITQSESNQDEFNRKMERLKAMGMSDPNFQYFAAGDRLVNLTEHFTKVWNNETRKFEKRVIVYAEDKIKLYDATLKECIGVDFWPFIVWSEDPETNDAYPDAIADTVRTPNKVLNVWFSQLIENRTLKNFQMHWYSPATGYNAKTYTPGPGVMIPAPPSPTGKISDVIQPVEISGLDDTFSAINAITQIVERGTGVSAIDKGQSETGTQTLGEVQILVGKAMERATAMQKFYRMAWYELAKKWDALMQANDFGPMTLKKTGANGKIYQKRVFMTDWKSEAGYEPTVTSTSEQETNDVKSLQKFQYVQSQYPNNSALRQIAQKRQLKLLDLSPEELKQVEDEEKKLAAMPMPGPMAGATAPATPPGAGPAGPVAGPGMPAQGAMPPQLNLGGK